MNILQRATTPTPKFFKILRNIGLALAAASGAILASPVMLPTTVIAAAGYVAVAGAVVSAISQITVETE